MKKLILLSLVAPSVVTAQPDFRPLHDPLFKHDGAAMRIASSDGQAKLVFACIVNLPERPMTVQLQLTSRRLGSYDTSVIYTEGDGPFTEATWYSSPSVAQSQDRDQIDNFARYFKRERTVTIRAYDREGKTIDASFDLAGAAPLSQQVLESCGAQKPIGLLNLLK